MAEETDDIFNELEEEVDELIKMLDLSGEILTCSVEIEDLISKNGGTIIYTYDNIIVASEISDNLYSELKKNPNIEYIQDLPLKRYGEV